MECIDQMGRKIQLYQAPKRIISLVPSQTELLYDLGLEQAVVGITKFCIHPKSWFQSKTRVGGTKKVHFDRIEALQPDLIIGNKEENEKEMIEALEKKYPVWMSDIVTIADAFDMMLKIGELLQRSDEAIKLVHQLKADFEQLQYPAKPLSVLYLIWQKPMMAAASGTFIHQMLQAAGFRNALENQHRYPEIDAATLQALEPDCIFLSSEPYPFKNKHIAYFKELCPKAEVLLVDGELFSWYGSRMLKSVAYFKQLSTQLLSD